MPQYERLKQAAATQPGLIAQQELDDAQAKDLSARRRWMPPKSSMAAANSHADAAQADNQRVQALQDYTNVTAPLDGVVDLALCRYGRADSGRDQFQRARTFPSFGFRRAACCACGFPCPKTMSSLFM